MPKKPSGEMPIPTPTEIASERLKATPENLHEETHRISVDLFLKTSEVKETMKGFADAIKVLSKEVVKAQAEGKKSTAEMLSNEIKRLEKIFGEIRGSFDFDMKHKRLQAAGRKYRTEGKKFSLGRTNSFGKPLSDTDIFNTVEIFGVGRSNTMGIGPLNSWQVGELPGGTAGRVEPLYVSENKEKRESGYKRNKEFTPEIIEAIEVAIARAEEAAKGEDVED